jgi:hypothetical protein
MKINKNMNYEISFQEMNELGKKILSQQSKITLAQAKQQIETLKKQSSQKNQKKST